MMELKDRFKDRQPFRPFALADKPFTSLHGMDEHFFEQENVIEIIRGSEQGREALKSFLSGGVGYIVEDMRRTLASFHPADVINAFLGSLKNEPDVATVIGLIRSFCSDSLRRLYDQGVFESKTMEAEDAMLLINCTRFALEQSHGEALRDWVLDELHYLLYLSPFFMECLINDAQQEGGEAQRRMCFTLIHDVFVAIAQRSEVASYLFEILTDGNRRLYQGIAANVILTLTAKAGSLKLFFKELRRVISLLVSRRVFGMNSDLELLDLVNINAAIATVVKRDARVKAATLIDSSISREGNRLTFLIGYVDQKQQHWVVTVCNQCELHSKITGADYRALLQNC